MQHITVTRWANWSSHCSFTADIAGSNPARVTKSNYTQPLATVSLRRRYILTRKLIGSQSLQSWLPITPYSIPLIPQNYPYTPKHHSRKHYPDKHITQTPITKPMLCLTGLWRVALLHHEQHKRRHTKSKRQIRESIRSKWGAYPIPAFKRLHRWGSRYPPWY